MRKNSYKFSMEFIYFLICKLITALILLMKLSPREH